MFGKSLTGILSISAVMLWATANVQADWKSDWEKAVTEGKKEGTVILYGGYNPVYREYAKIFERKYPGITVDFIPGGGSQHATRIVAERRAGKYVADMVMGGATTFQRYPNGTFDPISDFLILPEVTDGSVWLGGNLPYIDPEAKYVLTSKGSIGRGIAYNTKLVKPEEINAWRDLLDPKWKGKIERLNRRNAISNTLLFFYHSKDLGPDFLRQMYTDNHMVETTNLRQSVNWLAEGKVSIFLDATPQSINKAKDKGLPVDFLKKPLKEGNLVAGGYCCMAVLNKAPHPNATKLLVNWILSKEGQIEWQKATNDNSLRVDIPKEDLPPEIVPQPGQKYFLGDLSQYSQVEDLKAIRKLIEEAKMKK